MFDATFLLRWYSNYRVAQLKNQNTAHIQEQQLLRLVRKASATRIGQEFQFDSVKNVAEYQVRVPLRTYDAFWETYWKQSFPRLENITWPGTIPYFAVSSGTSSGVTKYIPYTHEMTASNKRAGLDMLVHHLSNCPASRIFGGRSFMLGGSTDFVEREPGIYSGDLSGIAVKTLPWWAKARYFPPPELALLKDWEEKISILAERSLSADIRMLSGVPSWMLIFFDRLAELLPQSEGRIAGIYPQLELLVHGGVNFTPYLPRFKQLLEGSKAELREVYPASEGFIAVADQGYGDGLRMVLDHGIFYEFVPFEELDSPKPTRHWIGTIEPNINYAIVLTTCAGLWSYILGDTVKFVSTNPPRLLITGRTAYYLSAFGEHIIAEEVEDAISVAANHIGKAVSDFSVGPVYPEKSGELGGHLYIVEFTDGAPDRSALSQFAMVVDQHLCKRNEDYEAHRANGFGLRAPSVHSVSQGAFAEWMRSRGKLGGQHKVPRIIMKRELFDNLRTFTQSFTQESV